ncbi:MAG: hypothetical protein QOE35_2537 [Actinomycetota bacterium]
MREQLADGTLVIEVRRLIETAAVERLGWIRANARTVMSATRQDAVTLSALTGIAVGTVKGFLEQRDTSITNVVLIAIALGLALGDLERSPEEFASLLEQRRSVHPARPD